jgi:hypothetical protein
MHQVHHPLEKPVLFESYPCLVPVITSFPNNDIAAKVAFHSLFLVSERRAKTFFGY